jgi:hypothetical protein
VSGGSLKPGDYVLFASIARGSTVGYVEAVEPHPSGGWVASVLRYSGLSSRWLLKPVKCRVRADGTSQELAGPWKGHIPIDLDQIKRRREAE